MISLGNDDLQPWYCQRFSLEGLNQFKAIANLTLSHLLKEKQISVYYVSET